MTDDTAAITLIVSDTAAITNSMISRFYRPVRVNSEIYRVVPHFVADEVCFVDLSLQVGGRESLFVVRSF